MVHSIRRFFSGVMVIVLLCVLFSTPGTLSAPVTADETPQPDLIIETLSGPPNAPNIGTMTTFSATVRNQGDAESAPCKLDFNLGETALDSLYVAGIAAGESITCILTWKAEAGDHVLTVTVDPENVVAERDETNNTLTLAFSVLAADLVVRGITWEPETVSAGDTVTFTVSISNQGSQSSRYGEFEFFIDDCSRGRFEVPVLAPSATVERTISWTAQPGNVTVRAELDIWNATREGNEANNSYSTIFSTADPDLIIDAITWTPEERTDTDNVTLSFVVKNQGRGSSFGSWLTCYLDGVGWINEYIGPLSANTTATVNYNWHAGSDNQTINATIDPRDEILETDEENNTTMIVIPAIGMPDLVLEKITCTPATPEVNQPVSFTVTVKNAGTSTAYQTNLTLKTSYFFNLSFWIDALAPGQTIDHTFVLTAKDRELNVSAIADFGELIRETDETNNKKSISVTPVQPTPVVDFEIIEAACSPASPKSGEDLTIRVTLKNSGPGAAPESHLACYIDDELLATQPVKSLKTGQADTIEFSAKAVFGTHTVRLAADYNNYVKEIDEENNEITIEYTTLAPDLTVKNLIWSPETPQLGDTVTLVAVIENRGNDISGETEIEYYVNGLARGQHYVNAIEPGETVVRTFTWQAQIIPESFGAYIDKGDSVRESNELNNEKLAPLPAPDISIQNITMSPIPAEADAATTFTVTVTNIGAGNAGITGVAASINGTMLPLTPCDQILPGESRNISFFWRGEPGNYLLTVTTDEADRLVEASESNNIASLLFSVVEPSSGSDNTTEFNAANGAGGLSGGEPSLILPDNETESDPISVELFEQPQDEEQDLPEINEAPSSSWWEILTNLWFLVGVSAFGVISIGTLLFLRRRMANNQGEPAEVKAAVPDDD